MGLWFTRHAKYNLRCDHSSIWDKFCSRLFSFVFTGVLGYSNAGVIGKKMDKPSSDFNQSTHHLLQQRFSSLYDN